MAVRSNLNATLQENLITILAFNDREGKVVSNLVDPALFEGEYRVVAERSIDYWHRFGESPKDHTPDLVSDILDDPGNRKANAFRRILNSMFQLAPSVNTVYVIDQLRTFMRMQRLKDGILKSAERLNARQELAIEEVESIWNELLRSRQVDFEPGLRLSELDHIIDSFTTRSIADEFKTGIVELDHRGIVPARGTVLLFIGSKGTGKSWFCIQCGKLAILDRKRVLHVTLEMSEEQVAKRYYQSFFSVSRRHEKVRVSTIQRNALGRIDEITFEDVATDFTLENENIRDELVSRFPWFAPRFRDLIIKRFPTRDLTPEKLEAYLDMLELVEGFIPDLVILDYLGLMKTNADNHRISLGRTFEDLRGLCVKRNYAFITPHQAHRAAVDSSLVDSKHVAEDWSLVGTADQVITISKTKAEKRFGLARLWVSHARDEGDSFGVLITQNYDIGQFVIGSVYLHADYPERLKELLKSEEVQEASEYDAAEGE